MLLQTYSSLNLSAVCTVKEFLTADAFLGTVYNACLCWLTHALFVQNESMN